MRLIAIVLIGLLSLAGCQPALIPMNDQEGSIASPQTIAVTPARLATMIERAGIRGITLERQLINILLVLEAHPEYYSEPKVRQAWGIADGSSLGDIYEFIETLDANFQGEP